MKENLFKRTHALVDSVYMTAFVSNTMGGTRSKRKSQKGTARFKRKPRLVDKIGEGLATGLSGPAPNFAKMGIFLAKQAFKGIKDNVHHYQRGKGLGTVLSAAAKSGYKLGRDKSYGLAVGPLQQFMANIAKIQKGIKRKAVSDIQQTPLTPAIKQSPKTPESRKIPTFSFKTGSKGKRLFHKTPKRKNSPFCAYKTPQKICEKSLEELASELPFAETVGETPWKSPSPSPWLETVWNPH